MTIYNELIKCFWKKEMANQYSLHLKIWNLSSLVYLKGFIIYLFIRKCLVKTLDLKCIDRDTIYKHILLKN